jgi:hypothetical protein
LFDKEPIDKPFVAKKVNARRVAARALNQIHEPKLVFQDSSSVHWLGNRHSMPLPDTTIGCLSKGQVSNS